MTKAGFDLLPDANKEVRLFMLETRNTIISVKLLE